MSAKSYILKSIMVAIVCYAIPIANAEETNVSLNPVPKTTENNTEQQIQAGQKLFESICAHCHNITYEESRIGAPGLQDVLERHDEAWLNQWIKSPETFAQNDVTARDLIDSNRFGLAMPTLPAMQNEESRQAVIEYLKTLK